MKTNTVDAYFAEIQAPVLSREAEIEAFRRYHAGDKSAGDQLVVANLRFVVTVAKKYLHLGLPMEDLISAGNDGLMVALRRFDETRGHKFISFAVHWINQRIWLALSKAAHQGMLPNYWLASNRRLRDIESRLAQSLQRQPTADEVAVATGWGEERLGMAQLACQPMERLHREVFEDPDSELAIDNVPDPGPSLEERCCDLQRGEVLERLMVRLDRRERTVVEQFFGLTGGEPMILETIGEGFHVTRERIRQIRNVALGKMRRAADACGLRLSDLVDDAKPPMPVKQRETAIDGPIAPSGQSVVPHRRSRFHAPVAAV